MRAVAPALATGNSIMLKPDPRTALTGGIHRGPHIRRGRIAERRPASDARGRRTGEAVRVDPDIAMVSFTGSSNVGRRIGELAGKHLKKVQLELGGKNAVIVLDDAELK